jgi:uncharacterized protein (DUF1330 family)
MTAYLIVLRQEPLRDPDSYAEYQRRTRANPPKVRGRPLVANGAIEPLEGDAPDSVVVLEFASAEDARAWYESEAYQEALPHRLNAARYQSFIVEGFRMPGANA